MVVEGVPFQIQNLARVSNHFAALEIDAAGVIQRDDHERRVRHNGQKMRVNGAKVAIVAASNHTDVCVAALLSGRQSVDMAEFRRTNSTEP